MVASSLTIDAVGKGGVPVRRRFKVRESHDWIMEWMDQKEQNPSLSLRQFSLHSKVNLSTLSRWINNQVTIPITIPTIEQFHYHYHYIISFLPPALTNITLFW